MRAVVRTEWGGPVTIADLPTPQPGKGEVLVRVSAAGIDAGAKHIIDGEPRLLRLGMGRRAPRDARVGTELAGVIEAVGAEVTDFAVGDSVFGVAHGSFADAVVAKPGKLATMPASFDPADAAASAVSGITALDALGAAGPLDGRRVLVLGAGGGVGTFLVQLAVAAGASVTGVCSTAKTAAVTELGASHVVDYRQNEPTGEFDVLFAAGGIRPLTALRDLLVPKGVAVLIGGDGGAGLLGGFEKQLLAPLTMAFSGRRFVTITSSTTTAKLESLVQTGVRPVIDRRYPLAQSADALAHFASGAVIGKLVLVP